MLKQTLAVAAGTNLLLSLIVNATKLAAAVQRLLLG